MTEEYSCGGIVMKIEAGERLFLLVQMLPGHWSFPKGHREAGETEHDTAIREIQEETHLDVCLLPGFREVTEYHPAPQVHKQVTYFLAKPLNDEVIIQAEEIKEAAWFNFKAASKRLTFQNDVNVLWLANDYLTRYEETNGA